MVRVSGGETRKMIYSGGLKIENPSPKICNVLATRP